MGQGCTCGLTSKCEGSLLCARLAHEPWSSWRNVTPVYDDVPDSCQLKILDPEVCLPESAAVWHVLLLGSVSRIGEQALQGCEDVLLCTLRGSSVLRAAEQMVAEGVDGEAFARAFVMLELHLMTC